ncbi:2-keto-4-pentenoate hydratase [Microbispora hainanensis]|uniref:Fumarylacetoacetate hydrolase family protein n=1 Tax=Microbispora hainanensis TaxID=568844 RepID=A0ABZ1SKS0_9ACTN|nr:fumarylacetoacetate hydrolase family protein [Microbispora hainanensis]
MDTTERDRLVGELLDAYRTREPVDPPTSRLAGLTIDDAYAIQLGQIDCLLADGAVVKGHKVGLTSAAMRRQLGVDAPDYGHLTDTMFHPEGAPIDVSRFLQPRIEPEIAFVLSRPLRGPGVTVAEAVAAVDFVLPALEIIDSRVRDWRITLIDTIADNASSGGVVLGGTPARPSDLDLRLTGCVLRRNSEVAGTGAGAAVLGSPLNALVWLANTLGERGVTLEAGHTILPGSVTAAVPVAVGDVVQASFAGLGTVTAVFGEDR